MVLIENVAPRKKLYNIVQEGMSRMKRVGSMALDHGEWEKRLANVKGSTSLKRRRVKPDDEYAASTSLLFAL